MKLHFLQATPKSLDSAEHIVCLQIIIIDVQYFSQRETHIYTKFTFLAG